MLPKVKPPNFEKRQNVFETFHKIINETETTRIWAKVSIIVLACQLLIFKLISVNLTFPNFQFHLNEPTIEGSIISTIYNIFTLFNFRITKDDQSLLYNFFYFTYLSKNLKFNFSVFGFIYVIKYLSLHFNIKYQFLQFTWVTALFTHFVTSFLWIYLVPLVTVFKNKLKFRFCQQSSSAMTLVLKRT